jgi:hypothetical protein
MIRKGMRTLLSRISFFITAAMVSVFLIAVDNQPTPAGAFPASYDIVSCDDDNRGLAVCYEAQATEPNTSTLKRDGESIGFELTYRDLSTVFGAAFSVSVDIPFDEVLPVVCGYGPDSESPCTDPTQVNAFAPLPGDVADFRILYPVTSTATASRGAELKSSSFATTKASEFDFSKTLGGSGDREYIIYDITVTFVEVWDRPNCGIDDETFNEDTGLFAPTPACGEVNTGSSGDSFSYRWQSIEFWTTSSGFITEDMDGGYINSRAPSSSIGIVPATTFSVARAEAAGGTGEIEIDNDVLVDANVALEIGDKIFLQGLSPEIEGAVTITAVDVSNASSTIFGFATSVVIEDGSTPGGIASLPGSIDFQEVGPKYASGGEFNKGAIEIFVPESYMRFIFGKSGAVSVSELLAQRIDVLSSSDFLVQNLTQEENGLTT